MEHLGVAFCKKVNSTRLKERLIAQLPGLRAQSKGREQRGKGVRRRVVDSAVIPGNWQSFLRVDSNKVELFSYRSTMLAESFQEEGKELVVTDFFKMAAISSTGLIWNASISKNVQNIWIYMCANFGAFRTIWTIGLLCRWTTRTIVQWNALPDSTTSAASVNAFRSQLYKSCP